MASLLLIAASQRRSDPHAEHFRASIRDGQLLRRHGEWGVAAREHSDQVAGGGCRDSVADLGEVVAAVVVDGSGVGQGRCCGEEQGTESVGRVHHVPIEVWRSGTSTHEPGRPNAGIPIRRKNRRTIG